MADNKRVASMILGKDKASVTLQQLAGGTIEDPKAMKIHSRSPKYSFWTLAVDRSTKAIDIIISIGNKIKTPVDDLVLYEVGELDGLVTEKRLPNDTLIIALYNKWLTDKTPKKFSINIEPGANAGASSGQSEFDARAEQKAKRLSAPPGSLSVVSKRSSSSEVVSTSPAASSSEASVRKAGSTIARSSTSISTPSSASGSAITITAAAPVTPGSGPVGRPMSGVMSSPVDGTHSPDQRRLSTAIPVAPLTPSPAPLPPAQFGLLNKALAAQPQSVVIEEVQIQHASPQRAVARSSVRELMPVNTTPQVAVAAASPPSPAPPASTPTMVVAPATTLAVAASPAAPQFLNAVTNPPSRNQSPIQAHPGSREQSPSRPRVTPSSSSSQLSHASLSPTPPALAVIDEAYLAELQHRLQTITMAMGGVPLAHNTDAHLSIAPEIEAQLDALYSGCFGVAQVPTNTSAAQKALELLSTGNDFSKEHCLRLMTHLTLDASNQAAIGNSTLLRPVAALLNSRVTTIQGLAAWTISNLSAIEYNKDRVRDAGAIPSLVLLLASNDQSAQEQALRAFCNILKNNDANKATFSKCGGAPICVVLLAKKELPETLLVLALRVLMLAPWTADNKAAVVRVGGLPAVVNSLASASAAARKMAAWLVSNLAVDGTVNDELRRLGGISHLVKLLGEQDMFVKEQAITVLANLAVAESNLDAIREANGIKCVLAVAMLPNATESLRLKAVWALSNLLVSEENQNYFQEMGGLKFLLHFLAHSNVKIQTRATAALVNLTQSSDSIRAEFGTLGGIELLMSALFNADPELEEYICKSLVNLSLNLNNEERMNCTLVPLLQRMQPPSQPRIRELATMTLANLALNEQIRNAIRENNGLQQVLVTFLKPVSDEQSYQALKMLTNLSMNGRNRAFMQKKGMLQVVKDLAFRTYDPLVREMANMAYTNLGFPVDEAVVNESNKPVNEFVKALVDEGITASRQAPPSQSGATGAGGNARKESPANGDFSRMREEAEAELRSLQRKREDYQVALRSEQLQRGASRASQLLTPAQKRLSMGLSPLAAPQPAAHAPEEPTLSPEEIAAKRAARIEKRGRIAAEILVTERTYVESLNIMIKKYMNPMLAVSSTKKPPLTEPQVKKIFSISELILNFHSMFLEGLEARILSWTEQTLLGDYFLRMAEFLRCYTQYVNNYENAIKILEELEKKPAFVQFLQKCTNSEDLKGLNLYSYLIMPIQRPPRYELLLSELLRYTDNTHPDHNNIKNAHQLIIEINLEVDEKKRLDENKRKVAEIDRQIIGGKKTDNLVAPHRLFVREGDLQSGNERFRVFLFNDIFVVCRPHPGAKRASTADGTAPLALFDQVVALSLVLASVSDVSVDDAAQFKIANSSDLSFLMTCTSKEECNQWVKDIAENINEQSKGFHRIMV